MKTVDTFIEIETIAIATANRISHYAQTVKPIFISKASLIKEMLTNNVNNG